MARMPIFSRVGPRGRAAGRPGGQAAAGGAQGDASAGRLGAADADGTEGQGDATGHCGADDCDGGSGHAAGTGGDGHITTGGATQACGGGHSAGARCCSGHGGAATRATSGAAASWRSACRLAAEMPSWALSERCTISSRNENATSPITPKNRGVDAGNDIMLRGSLLACEQSANS